MENVILKQNEFRELDVLCFIEEQREEMDLVVINELEVLTCNEAYYKFNGKVHDCKEDKNDYDILHITMISGEQVTMGMM